MVFYLYPKNGMTSDQTKRFMKKTLEPAKFWLIALAISLFSFIYLQLDQPLAGEATISQTTQELIDPESPDEAEVRMLDLDIVKGLTLVVMEYFLKR
jgi:hypothetical protein